jgi:hypothetical protein
MKAPEAAAMISPMSGPNPNSPRDLVGMLGTEVMGGARVAASPAEAVALTALGLNPHVLSDTMADTSASSLRLTPADVAPIEEV